MSGPSPRPDGLPAGLRERKKLKTRLAIQEHALRLFREQGYAQTTVEQIAEAAEVSPSTFFRYFPTKEDVVLFDPLDAVLIDAYRRQAPDVSPLQALRLAMHAVFDQMGPAAIAEQRQRGQLVFAAPELQAAWLADLLRTANLMNTLLAERSGRPADDPRLRMYAAGVMGVLMGAMVPLLTDPDADLVGILDEALDFVEAGMPFEARRPG